MNNLRRHRWNGGTAIFSAAMLFFQLVLGGFALGTAAAATPTLDIFGNPLCITGTHAPNGEDGREHSGLPHCCTPGCSMFAPFKSVDREGSAFTNPLALQAELSVPARVGIAALLEDHDPGNPRAPPLHL
ncbi:hypothetical protein GTW25_00935 [Aliihoeflea aestuarii]|uniref:hypothetical protein n=1 Tax=Aliihoeflea aestuarii TaxID=453840 RepID=UPI0020932746|nr:hypothetical protein [Aliihoeflea aestuarii]MCO6389595.1 hypothetical protein [Aliihoeflea aestuarii]